MGKSFKVFGLWQPVIFHGDAELAGEDSRRLVAQRDLPVPHRFPVIRRTTQPVRAATCTARNAATPTCARSILGGGKGSHSNDAFINHSNFFPGTAVTGQSQTTQTINDERQGRVREHVLRRAELRSLGDARWAAGSRIPTRLCRRGRVRTATRLPGRRTVMWMLRWRRTSACPSRVSGGGCGAGDSCGCVQRVQHPQPEPGKRDERRDLCDLRSGPDCSWRPDDHAAGAVQLLVGARTRDEGAPAVRGHASSCEFRLRTIVSCATWPASYKDAVHVDERRALFFLAGILACCLRGGAGARYGGCARARRRRFRTSGSRRLARGARFFRCARVIGRTCGR